MFRLAQAEDLPGLCRVIDEVGLTVSKVSSPALTRAICRDAIAGRGVLINVALFEGEVAGFVIAILDWNRYWKGFCLRHPVLGARMLLNRRGGTSTSAPAQATGAAWSDSSPRIAKILHLGAAERVRGRGLGALMYRDFMKQLAERGIERMDNLFAEDNHDSHRLHQFVGSTIQPCGRNFFAVTELKPC